MFTRLVTKDQCKGDQTFIIKKRIILFELLRAKKGLFIYMWFTCVRFLAKIPDWLVLVFKALLRIYFLNQLLEIHSRSQDLVKKEHQVQTGHNKIYKIVWSRKIHILVNSVLSVTVSKKIFPLTQHNTIKQPSSQTKMAKLRWNFKK